MPELSRAQVVVYGAIAVALLLVGARAIRARGRRQRGFARRPPRAARLGRELHASAARPATSSSTSTGAVTRPGVYRLPAGSRVDDAVRAGRRRRRAGASWKRSTSPPGSPTASRWWCPNAGRAAARRRSAAAAEEGPISLGTATVEQLDTIDGIGPVTAQDIVEFRDQHGGLASVDQLDQVSGIGPATMESLRARLQP